MTTRAAKMLRTPTRLRPYQAAAQVDLLRHFEGYLRGGSSALGYESPMGSGKTTTVKATAAWLLADETARLVVVAAPLNAIVSQWATLGRYAAPGFRSVRLPPEGANFPHGPAPRATASQMRDPTWWATARGYFVCSRQAMCTEENIAALTETRPMLCGVLVVGDEGHHHHDTGTAGAFFALLRKCGAATLIVSGTPWHGLGSVFTPETQVVRQSAAALALCVDPATGHAYAPSQWRVERHIVAGFKTDRADLAVESDAAPEPASPRGYVAAMCRAAAEHWARLGCPRTVINVPGAKAWKERLVAELRRAGPAALGREPVVVDLIGDMSDRDRATAQERLAADGKAPTYDHPARVDVVISCARMDEGTDWPPCSHVFNVRIPCSPLRILQRWARASRGKRAIVGYPEQWVDAQTMVFFVPTLSGEAVAASWRSHREQAVLLAAYLADYEVAAQWVDPRCFAAPDGAWRRAAARKQGVGAGLNPTDAPASSGDGDRRGGSALERARAVAGIVARIQKRGSDGSAKIAEMDAALAEAMPDVSTPARKAALLSLARGEEVRAAVAAAQARAEQSAGQGASVLRVREDLQADLDRIVAEFGHFEVAVPEGWTARVAQFTALDAQAVAGHMTALGSSEENARAIVAFHAEHGHWPRTGAKDPVERQIGRALNSLRTKRHDVCTRHAIPLVDPRYAIDYHDVQAREVIDFHAKKGHWPRQTYASEKRLANVLSGLRLKYPDVCQRHTIPLVDPRRASDYQDVQAQACVTFHANQGRWPSHSVTADADEKRLARALSHLRSNYADVCIRHGIPQQAVPSDTLRLFRQSRLTRTSDDLPIAA